MNKWVKNTFLAFRKIPLLFESLFDRHFLAKDVPFSRKISHQHWMEYLVSLANKPGFKVLEIGSREVTGKSSARRLFDKAEYVGFDLYAGSNVDVVGDAHKLSRYFDHGEFDLVFSSACFEHFAMPWIVSHEIAKVLKVGGLVMIETHYSFSSHERPWHFFQFSDMALRVLFSDAMGFECLEAGVSNPIVGRFSSIADPYLRLKPVGALYCHSEFLGRKVSDVPSFNWLDLDITKIAGGSYPEPPRKQ